MAKQIAIEFLIVLAFGLVLGLFGPFGTYAMETAPRLLYWVVFGVVGYAIFRPLTIVGRWLSEALSINTMFGIGLALFVAAMPMTLLVAFLMSDFDLGRALRWKGIGLLYFQVWLIGFLTNGFFTLMFKKHRPTVMPQPDSMPIAAPPEEAAPNFADRLPPGFGPLLALKGEDHYVRAISDTREAMILIRLKDAIAELGGVEGLQVHRSWWVARAGLARVVRKDRSATLILANGTEVPVARDKMAALKGAGWG